MYFGMDNLSMSPSASRFFDCAHWSPSPRVPSAYVTIGVLAAAVLCARTAPMAVFDFPAVKVERKVMLRGPMCRGNDAASRAAC